MIDKICLLGGPQEKRDYREGYVTEGAGFDISGLEGIAWERRDHGKGESDHLREGRLTLYG